MIFGGMNTIAPGDLGHRPLFDRRQKSECKDEKRIHTNQSSLWHPSPVVLHSMSQTSGSTMKPIDRSLIMVHPDERSTTETTTSNNNNGDKQPSPSKLSSKRAFFENAFKKQPMHESKTSTTTTSMDGSSAFAKNRQAVAQVLMMNNSHKNNNPVVPFMTTKEAKRQQQQTQGQVTSKTTSNPTAHPLKQQQEEETREQIPMMDRTHTTDRSNNNNSENHQTEHRQNILLAIQARSSQVHSKTDDTETTAPIPRPVSAPPTTTTPRTTTTQAAESPRFADLQTMWGSKTKSSTSTTTTLSPSKTNPRAPWKLTMAAASSPTLNNNNDDVDVDEQDDDDASEASSIQDDDDNDNDETDSAILHKPGDPYKFAYTAWYHKGLLDWRPAESDNDEQDEEETELVQLQQQSPHQSSSVPPSSQDHLSSQPSEESYGSTVSESKRATTPLQEARARAISYRLHTSKNQETTKPPASKVVKDDIPNATSLDNQSAASSKTHKSLNSNNSCSSKKKQAALSASSALSAYRNARRYNEFKASTKGASGNNNNTNTDPMDFRNTGDSDDSDEDKELQELLQLDFNLKSDSCEQSRSSRSSDASFRKKYRDLLDTDPAPKPMEPLREDDTQEAKATETRTEKGGRMTMSQRARRAAMKIKEAKSLAQRPPSRGATSSTSGALSPTNYRQLAHSPNVSLQERELMKAKFIQEARRRLESQKANNNTSEGVSTGVEIALSTESDPDILDKLVDANSVVQSDLLMFSLRSEDLEAADSIAATAQSAIAVFPPRPQSAPPQCLESRSLETTAAQMNEDDVKRKQQSVNKDDFELSHTKVNEFVKCYDKTTAGNSVLEKYKKKKSQASFKDKANLPRIKESDIGVVIVNKYDDSILPTEFSKEEDVNSSRSKNSEGVPQNKGYCDDQCTIM